MNSYGCPHDRVAIIDETLGDGKLWSGLTMATLERPPPGPEPGWRLVACALRPCRNRHGPFWTRGKYLTKPEQTAKGRRDL